MKFIRRLRFLFRRERRNAELAEEIRHHLDTEMARNRAAGMSPEDAEYAARRQFGGVEQIKEQARDQFGWVWWEQCAQDLRFGWRSLRRNPGFTTVAVLTLALGVGATTAIFSAVHAVLLRPLPYREPERLMMIEEKWLPRFPRFEAGMNDFLAWRAEGKSFGGIAAFVGKSFTLSSTDRPEQISGARVSANLPVLLGVEPVLGRSFTPEEDEAGRDHVVLLGHALWQRRFGGDPGVLGAVVQLDGETFTVVGVMPPDFRFPQNADLWKPMGFGPDDLKRDHFIWAVGRLAPGVNRAQAEAELDAILAHVRPGSPWRSQVVPLLDSDVGDVRPALNVLLGATALVLLIACGNVASLLLVRAAVRGREFALRVSLGAGRGRIVRQLLTEAATLSLLGGVVGVLLAWGTLTLVKRGPLPAIPRLEQATLDAPVLGFALGISVLTGLAFGLVPALRSARVNLSEAMQTRGATGSAADRKWMQRMVASEVALALVLLAGAGLLLKSFWKLSEVRPGFVTENVLTARINLPATVYREGQRQTQFVAELLERLRALPEMEGAAVTRGLPFVSVGDSGMSIEGRPANTPLAGAAANHYRVAPDYLRVMRIPLLRGRGLTERDGATSPPVVLINETIARRFFAEEDPIGKRIAFSGPTGYYFREIIGVVGDVKQAGLRTAAPPQIYEPFAQNPGVSFNLVVRASGSVARVAAFVREQVATVDKQLPLPEVRTMNELVSESLTRDRFSAFLLALFAGLSLALAAIGIYGVMAYSIVQRTKEFGIRLALGAQRRTILGMVLGGSLRTVMAGIGIGLAGSLALTRVLGALLYEVQPHDPLTFGAVAVILAAAGFAAALIPARRATTVDPIVALRSE